MTEIDLDAIQARAARLYERTATIDPNAHPDFGQLTDADVPALVAENRRLRAELADFSGRVNELESKLCDCEPVREHDDYKRPAAYQHEPHCPVTALDHAGTQSATEGRTLTEAEHNRAWHAIEGAAGEESADPGTVLNAVLRALGINPPAECPGFEGNPVAPNLCAGCGEPSDAHPTAPAARSAAV
ncbi:hypothetical protein [Streptomyces griseofuscus]|uniref:hypothetical protein n=1 Tax=Streptomyces griseofuscus TaxID=146922 RepID=UPI0033C8A52B